MNRYDFKVLCLLKEIKCSSQRELAGKLNLSIGLVNKSITNLKSQNLITNNLTITAEGINFLNNHKPVNAIILAAGVGLRMVPINQIKSKAFLTVKNQPLIERLIEQLLEKGICDITIVVGYLKESFDYLIDKYSVKLVYNPDYQLKNNLYSLKCVSNIISNTYILPCDLWCSDNPFNNYELQSWYSIGSEVDVKSQYRNTRKGTLEKCISDGNTLTGISFISSSDSNLLITKIDELSRFENSENLFWESALFSSGMTVYSNVFDNNQIIEINSYEQLRDLDGYSKELENESINIICNALHCKVTEISNIETLKKGMTNRSYIFSVYNQKYIMRIPGEGTDQLINRKNEADVYNAIDGKNICDKLFYINPKNGMKISAFVENSRCCNPFDVTDLSKCMKKLKEFHDLKIKVSHKFDIFQQIDFYESLWIQPSIFSDYKVTKENILRLKKFIDEINPEYCLTHIDAVPDNFLISNNDGIEQIQLIDWEYAGMQDPHVDIAMFCIYSLYDNQKYIDQLIDLYFDNNCSPTLRAKIYSYVAICGLLWSNWCEFKRQLGVEFGEYSIKQYRYAKDYFKIALHAINELGVEI